MLKKIIHHRSVTLTLGLTLIILFFYGLAINLLEAQLAGSPQGSSNFGSSNNLSSPRPSVNKSPTAPSVAASPFQEGGDHQMGFAYQIHVLGEVIKPGTYRVAASTRLSEAIETAGGILNGGSRRRIEIRREGQSRRIDFFSFELFGNLDENPYLLENDVVFVPLQEKVVQIAGTVRRPGYYELKNERTIQDLVKLAGGFTPGTANPTPLKVIRYVHDEKQVLDLPNLEEERRRFELKNADVVIVPHIMTEDKKFDYNLASLPGDNPLFFPSYDERVFVLGAVYNPGPYPYSPHYNLRQYLIHAGGTTKLAKPERKWKILRADTSKRIKARYDTEVNPGDTLIIPERYMAPESWLSLVLGTSSAALGITTTVLTLTR